MSSKTYFSELSQQFQNEQPLYSDNLIFEAQKKASYDRSTFLELLGREGFREKDFIRWLDLRKSSFANGMEAALDMERSGADIGSAKYILQPTTVNGLLFFNQYLKEEYFELCKEQKNPFWLFPIWEEFYKTNSLQFMNNLSPFLQGFFLCSIWNEHLREKEKQNLSLEQLLAIMYKQLPINTFMIFAGKVTEPLIRNSFDVHHQQKTEKNKQLLNQLLQWMTQTTGKIKLREETVESYLEHLKGRVNKESWLAALYFASKLDQLKHSIASENAFLIRKKVTDAYPLIWLSSNTKNSSFLSGEKSIVLITELADTFLKLYGDNAVDAYWSHDEITEPQNLWFLRNKHEYESYINKRTLVFVHCLLLTKMIEKSACTLQMAERLHDYVNLVLRQVPDHHIFSGEELVVQHLLETLGLIYEKIGILKEAAPELINNIAFPGYAVYFLKRLNKNKNTYADILGLVESKVESDLPLMRKKERISLSYVLYNVGAWLQCCKVVKDSTLMENAFDYQYENLIPLYGSAVLQSIPYFSDEQTKAKYLNDAFLTLSNQQRRNPHTKKSQGAILRGYLVGELYDMEQLDFITLNNEYYGFTQQSFKGLEDDAAFSYVKLLLLIRLIHDSPEKSQRKAFMMESEKLVKKTVPLQGMAGTKALIRAWLTDQNSGSGIQEYIKEVQAHADEVKEAVLHLPRPVREFAEKILTGD